METLLLIETATEVCSVGLYRGSSLLSLQEAPEAYRHAGQLTLLIQAAFAEAGLTMEAIDAVALSSGPGSYTALRVGAATAKGICYALDKPLIAIDTLRALALAAAQQHPDFTYYAPMIDARRMEVYTAVYDRQHHPVLETHALVVEADSFDHLLAEGQRILCCGNGAEKCNTVLTSPQITFIPLPCSARFLAPLALEAYRRSDFVDVAYFSPTYLKPPNITKPRKLL